MKRLFEYRDDMLYCHHTLDVEPQPADFPVHTHEMLEIYYFISGKGSYLVEGTPYDLNTGDILVMREAETHKLQIDTAVPYERIAIHFSAELVRRFDVKGNLLRPFMDRPLGQLNQYRANDFRNLQWTNAFLNFNFSDSAEIRAHIFARLFMLLPELCDAYDKRSGEIVVRSGEMYQLVAYVNEHLFTDISMQMLCDTFYCSSSQISRLFDQATGTSLKRYINIKRLLAARVMLQRGESAGTVCTTCGFSDYSAFYRAYKKQFSQSPRNDIKK